MESSKIKDFVVKMSGWGLAISTYHLFNRLWDYVLYTAVVVKYGPLYGGTIMIVASFVLDLGSILLYTWLGKDIFGIQELRDLEEHEKHLGLKKVFGKILKRGRLTIFLFLCVTSNPFFLTAYFQSKDPHHRKPGQLMTGLDWKYFLSSFLIGNFIWIGVIQIGVWTGIIQTLWSFVIYLWTILWTAMTMLRIMFT